jgi:integrase
MMPTNVIAFKKAKPTPNKIPLTMERIRKLPYAKGAQKIYWDSKLSGFGVRVGLSAKTFIVQRDVNGKSKKVSIDKFGVISLDDARDRAMKLLSRMGEGIDPNKEKRIARAKGITLREAVEAYKTSRKNLSERTKSDISNLFNRYLAKWLDKPLAEITIEEVAKRHIQIVEGIKANPRYPTSKATGTSTANTTMRWLRTIYKHALAVNDSLPPNPVMLLSTTRAWYPDNKRTGHIQPADLKKWISAIQNVPNDVQRDYALLVLFTGLRRIEAATLEWKNVDLKAKLLHIPVTKNKKPLALPLSNFLVTLLKERRKRCGEDERWVFPASSKSGHIAEPRYALDCAAKECGVDVTVHDLRRTFITIAESCDVPTYVFKALVNHSTAGDVTGTHYIQMSVERMRPWMQKITDAICK